MQLITSGDADAASQAATAMQEIQRLLLEPGSEEQLSALRRHQALVKGQNLA